ncbi:MAG: MFS transporter, partial [Saprospiraceae bacterium]|nr:MFS transporter [Saprospiraceae bacterium]
MITDKMSPYAALRESEFQYYLFARFFITMALSLPPVLLGWRLYELTENELVLGNVFLAELIPALALALYAGHIVDLYEKRKLLLVCYFGYVVFTIALLVITLDCTFAAYPLSVIIYGIYAIMFLGGIIRAFSDPVGFALLPRIVPRELLVNAGTWS